MPTLEAFQAIRKRYPGSNVWLERLAKLELAEFRAILERIPPGRISPPAKDFATEMLRVNRERLLSLEN